MKNLFCTFIISLFSNVGISQNVGIGTNLPQARLEISDTTKTTVKIASKNYLDTSQLIFSNRTADSFGTDFIISSNSENGMKMSSKSDLSINNHDSIIILTPQGRIGVNNNTPTERLDIRGNLNITGTIKTNGNPGSPNQFLMQDEIGNMTWGDLAVNFKKFVAFRIPGSGTWTVPSGVTEIMVELIGGGAGGTAWGGGGGGGFAVAKLPVNAGGTINYTVGSGGAGVTIANSNNGGFSNIFNGSTIITAEGASGASFNNSSKVYSAPGGSFSSSPAAFNMVLGMNGSNGKLSKISFQQKSPTAYYEIISDGNGGGPGNCRNGGSNGATFMYDYLNANVLQFSQGESLSIPGSGGSGGFFSTSGYTVGGGMGNDGIVIIRY